MSRYKVYAHAEAHGQAVAFFSKSYRSFKQAARAATQYSRMYGHARVIDAKAPTARGNLMVCTGSRKAKRSGGNADFAHCTVSSEGKKLLKKKRGRR